MKVVLRMVANIQASGKVEPIKSFFLSTKFLSYLLGSSYWYYIQNGGGTIVTMFLLESKTFSCMRMFT
jgi:hypothetical protein